MRFTTQLLPKRSGNLGVLLLNHPRPMHALTIDMVRCCQDVLTEWYKDETLKAFLVRSTEAKVPAFCAGGDVKQVYLAGCQAPADENDDDTGTPPRRPHGQGIAGVATADFFRDEYIMNYLLATSPIPQISIWDGIVMGGGVGLSIYGKYRVATERTVFAMPETAIGLFPDVGSMYWMPRMLPFSTALYLALTGVRLNACDLMDTGLATHYIPSSKINDLEAALVDATTSGGDAIIQTVLDSLTEVPVGKSSLNQGLIDEAFGRPEPESMERLMEQLGKSSDPAFGAHTIATLNKMSPVSLKVTMEGLKRGRDCADIAEDLAMEFRIAQACMRNGSDFYEGVRAVLVDKDHTPKWNPSLLASVDQTTVNTYFEPIQEEWAVPENVRSIRKPLSKL